MRMLLSLSISTRLETFLEAGVGLLGSIVIVLDGRRAGRDAAGLRYIEECRRTERARRRSSRERGESVDGVDILRIRRAARASSRDA